MPATHVVLVNPEIHRNTGNAGQTCLATGARLHLVRPLGFSLDEREVRRAGLVVADHRPNDERSPDFPLSGLRRYAEYAMRIA